MTYLVFELDDEASAKRKTNVWDVVSTSGTPLGKIKWYAAWRQYVFYPWGDTLFNRGCMEDIIAFITTEMDRRA